jgi:hypothetical protein
VRCFSPSPSSQSGGPALLIPSRLLIRSYPPYLEAASSVLLLTKASRCTRQSTGTLLTLYIQISCWILLETVVMRCCLSLLPEECCSQSPSGVMIMRSWNVTAVQWKMKSIDSFRPRPLTRDMIYPNPALSCPAPPLRQCVLFFCLLGAAPLAMAAARHRWSYVIISGVCPPVRFIL